MQLRKTILALTALCLFCPGAAYANVTPVSDILASQCRQLEGAHGPTREFPNTFYANLVFQCSTAPGTAPAGDVFKAIEQYGKALVSGDARIGARCEITQANGGANILSQGPMEPTEPSSSKDVVISYNAKYACLSPKAARGLTRYTPAYAPEQDLNLATVPYTESSTYSEHRTNIEDVSYIPPRPSWVARDQAYNQRKHGTKAVYRAESKRAIRHRHHHATTKAKARAAEQKPTMQKVKVEVKIEPAPAPAPSNRPVIIQGGPAPTSPLPGFNSP